MSHFAALIQLPLQSTRGNSIRRFPRGASSKQYTHSPTTFSPITHHETQRRSLPATACRVQLYLLIIFGLSSQRWCRNPRSKPSVWARLSVLSISMCCWVNGQELFPKLGVGEIKALRERGYNMDLCSATLPFLPECCCNALV